MAKGVLSQGFRQFWVNEGPMYTFVLIWMAINVFLFFINFVKYRGDEWTYIRVIVKDGLPVARGAANVLAFNCAIILLPVCRNLVDKARGCFECSRSIRRLFDKNILFHKWCAYTICMFVAIHIGAHIFNIYYLCNSSNPNAKVLLQRDCADTPTVILFVSTPGITGVIITLCLVLMVTTAVDQIRRSFFELFWYTHHLFIVFYLALMMHGYAGFIRVQTNFEQFPYFDDEDYIDAKRDSAFCGADSSITSGLGGICMCPKDIYQELTCPSSNVYLTQGKDEGDGLFCLYNITSYPDVSPFCCPCYANLIKSDVIIPGGPSTWMWVIGPLVLYLCERFYRFFMSQTRKLQVLSIIKHNDTTPVMEVRITKVKTKSGQYAFLHCPSVSMLEWHPFTLTSCPGLTYISFHIRLVGDWTCAFAERCGFYDEEVRSVSQLPKVAIDGPFGTSSEDIFDYEVGICVCAGIGVTPFASLLQELFLRKFEPKAGELLKTKTVYFYWMCPGFDSWGWFSNLLVAFEHKCIEEGYPDFLKARVHMTRGWSKDDAEKLFLQDDSEAGDLIVRDDKGRGLQSKMNFGRPDWSKDMAQMTTEHAGKDIGIFFCGPKILSSQLHEKANEFTDASGKKGHKTRFFYNKENF